jgi:type VI secretion system protein ImpH
MAGLIETLSQDARSFDFFRAVSLLEKDSISKGISDPLNSGMIRFLSDLSTVFPQSDITSIKEGKNSVFFTLAFMGLTGVSSPLPLYFSDYICRHTEDSEALIDFLSIFSHRTYCFFYQAWKKHNLLNIDRNQETVSFLDRIMSLAGIPERENTDLLPYGGLFISGKGTAEGLCALVSSFCGGIPTEIQEFLPNRVHVHDLRPLGSCCLGQDSLLGSSIVDFGSKFRITVGPLKGDIFKSFLSTPDIIEQIRVLADSFLTTPLEYDIEIKVRSQDLEQCIIGKKQAALGKTSILGEPKPGIHSVVFQGRKS